MRSLILASLFALSPLLACSQPEGRLQVESELYDRFLFGDRLAASLEESVAGTEGWMSLVERFDASSDDNGSRSGATHELVFTAGAFDAAALLLDVEGVLRADLAERDIEAGPSTDETEGLGNAPLAARHFTTTGNGMTGTVDLRLDLHPDSDRCTLTVEVHERRE